MENKKLIGLLIAIPILMAVMAVFASGAVTLNRPAQGGNYSGTINVNCTALLTDMYNITNATVYYNRTGGAAQRCSGNCGGASGILTTLSSVAENTTSFQASTSITGLTDAATYNFSCSMWNGTGATMTTVNGTANLAVTIDNTAPTVIMTIPSTRISTGRLIDYKCNTNDAIDTSPSSTFTLTDPNSKVTNLTSDVNIGFNKQYTDTRADGSYVFACDVTDDSGNSPTAASTTVTVSLSGYAKTTDGTTLVNGQVPANYTPIIVIIAIILIVWFANKRK